ncbi:MAG: BamA/TamA family outer membrane protein [Dictyoglomus thermophilum]|uniref:Outer membrane protein assembly factor n=1 Tax=Dictyoglomus thermophilum TaxID=14 RepID=A0A7V3ZK52_DICTH|nr:outer membrane protein assembly factor [Dictyoglomus thermophilum]MCX7721342.1 BamA/TamA family outer membrane protein [Dictyoglomus thermophilum]TYT22933.1 BamA/TamA family outer membrane protein [Dictyoglomus thermophilum]
MGLNKKFLFFIAFIFALICFTFAQSEYKIEDIVIKGNQKISTQEILNMVGVSKGANITDDQINKIKEKLDNSTYFLSVVINKLSGKSGIILEINVVESPFLIFINGISFQGLQRISVKELQNLIILPAIGWTTDERIWEQKRKFMSTGYFSKVDVNEVKSGEGFIVIFNFQENPVLEKIEVKGLQNLRKEDVLSMIGIKEGMLISEDDLMAKKEEIISSNMFSKVEFNITKKENKLYLTINLEENPLVSKVGLIGNNKSNIKDIQAILSIVGDISENTIISKSSIYYSEELISLWKAKLLETGYFKKVELNPKRVNERSVEVEITVVENPWVVAIDVKGLVNLKKEKVMEVISGRGRGFLNDNYLNELKEKLLSTGWFSSVDTKYVITPNNYAYITLTVVENPILKSITYSGLRLIPENEIKKYCILKEGDFISDDRIEEQITKFENMGYFSKVSVEKSVENDKVSLNFIFNENPEVKKIVFEGLFGVSEKELRQVLLNKEGLPFNSVFLDKDVQSILNLLQSKGYVFASIQNVVFNNEGELIFYFKDYKVEDIQVEIIPSTETSVLSFLAIFRRPTDKNVVKREISLSVGESVNIEKIKSDLQRIYNVGIFEDVSVRFDKGSTEDSVKVVYVVKEKLSGSFNFGGGYATDVGLYGFVEYKEKNLFGKAQQLSLQLSLTSLAKINYQLTFIDPWFLGGRNAFQLDLYDKKVNVTDATTSSTSTFEKAGGAFSFSYPLENFWSISLGFKYESITPIESSTMTTSTTVGSFNVGLWRDTRDFYLNPTQGSRQAISIEFAGGGSESNFIKYNVDLQWHLPLTNRESSISISQQKERQVLSLKIGFGFEEGNFPSTELFTLGGTSTIRGFSDNIFKGDTYLLFNMQYRIPLGNNLYGVLFVDSGSAWYRQDVTSLTDIKFYTGIGLGLRYDTLIIPIRIDFGYNFGNDPIAPNTKWRVHFSFGDIF